MIKCKSDLGKNLMFKNGYFFFQAVIEVLLSGVSVTCRKTIPFLANDSLLTLSAGDRNDDSPDSCSISWLKTCIIGISSIFISYDNLRTN